MAHIVVHLVHRLHLYYTLVPVSGRVENVVHARCCVPRGPVVSVHDFFTVLDFDVVD